MSEVTVLSQNLPAHLRNAAVLDDTTKALMGGGGGAKRISIKGGVWRMMVNGKEVARNEDRSMNVVIVAASPKVSRTYYSEMYVENSKIAPECWSADGEVPDPTARKAQAKTCASCPQNVKGSGQGDSRACRFSQRLAVVLENDIGGDIYQLTLPAASIFGAGEPGKWPLQTYAKMIGSKGVPITSVVTEMRFDTNSAVPRLFFKPARYLEAEEFETALQKSKHPDAIRAITMTVAQADTPEPAEEVPAIAAPSPKVETPKEAEPVKRTNKKEEAPAPKKDLDKILAEWDDQ